MKRILFAVVALGLMALANGCCHHLCGGAPNPCNPCGPYGGIGAIQPASYVAAAPACSNCQPF
jgi:hypothetical protein